MNGLINPPHDPTIRSLLRFASGDPSRRAFFPMQSVQPTSSIEVTQQLQPFKQWFVILPTDAYPLTSI